MEWSRLPKQCTFPLGFKLLDPEVVSAGDEEKATEDSLTILGGLGSGGGLDMRKFAWSCKMKSVFSEEICPVTGCLNVVVLRLWLQERVQYYLLLPGHIPGLFSETVAG